MGHQFSGNHPFNGNQLNCSAGNRNAATSVEPGSGSSIMAYAGICLTDDLQPHSDPYFSQRSQQEITTYVSSNQAAINEVQTASLRHFGGGNEVQVVTFGPGYAPTSTVQPLALAINAAPTATSRGGAEENGNTVTIATGNPHTLQVGDSVTIGGVGVAGYNGTWTVTAVPSSRSFQYSNPTAGLATSGGGTVTFVNPGATESGTTVTISTALPHGRSVGDVVTISGVSPTGYNGTFTITAVPTARTFQYTAAASGLANGGAGTVTFFSPFRIKIGSTESGVIGGQGAPYTNANIQSAITAITGAGTATVSGAASTGFTVTYGGALANTDVASFQLSGLSCGGCFGSVEETNHGGANDSFRLNYNGTLSAPITNGVNFSAAGILAALTPILPAGATATVAGFAGGGFNNTGFQVTFTGALAASNVPVLLGVQDFTAGASGFVNETDKGGAVDNKGIVTPTGNAIPAVTVPAGYSIPLRTPFALTGTATDGDGNPLLYSWEQNDRGAAAGTSLLNNTKTNGPLFAMFPKSGIISETATLQYDSPGENHLTGEPTRVFPDLQQIIDNNTNADTGACTTGPVAPPVPISVKECFAEFLPTSDYVGFAGVNATPPSLHFRLTARDGRGGNSSADETITIVPTAGPFRVTAPNTAVTWPGSSAQTVAWDVAGTNLPPISTDNVRITLSTDGGHTYPIELAASTPNDGTESVTIPNIGTTQARIRIEAVGNVYFDLSNADFTIHALPVAANSLGGGSQNVAYGDALAPDVTVTVTDADTAGSALSAAAAGLPAGLSLAIASTGANSRAWKVAGNDSAAPGSYPVTVTGTDDTGNTATTSFTIVVVQRPLAIVATNRTKAYGDTLALGSTAFTAPNLVAGDGIASVTLTSVGAAAAAGAGTYAISISAAVPQGATSLANYAITYVPGTLTVYAGGIVGLDAVTLSGNASVDSFDSSAGPYGGGNKGAASRLLSNGAITGNGKPGVDGSVRSSQGSVSLGNGTVSGNVVAGGTISGGTIGGTSTAHSPATAITAPAVAACAPFSSPSGLSGGFSYDPASGDLSVSGGKTVTLADGSYCFHDVKLTGGSTVMVNGPVSISLTGQLKATGGSFANGTNVPANLQISSSYSGSAGVQISGGAGAYLSIYAPRTGVSISGNSPVFGAVLGKTITLSGDASLHYDVRRLAVWATPFGL
jgi:hypothetical protein